MDSAFEQIRLYAKADVAVSLRMLRALGDISLTIPDMKERHLIADRGRRIVAGCAAQIGEEEVRELRARQASLEKLVEAVSPLPGAPFPALNNS